ncbi:phage minor tail protein L [Escherichia coli]
MQDIHEASLNESVKSEQSPRVVLWEIDLTVQGGERYCMWDYRGDECGYNGPAVADEFDNPTTDIRKDRCSKCMRGCEMRGMVANFGGFLSINKLSQ